MKSNVFQSSWFGKYTYMGYIPTPSCTVAIIKSPLYPTGWFPPHRDSNLIVPLLSLPYLPVLTGWERGRADVANFRRQAETGAGARLTAAHVWFPSCSLHIYGNFSLCLRESLSPRDGKVSEYLSTGSQRCRSFCQQMDRLSRNGDQPQFWKGRENYLR